MRDDHGELLEDFVAADVVQVVVRVHEKLDRLVRDLPDLGHDPRREILELRVDDEDRLRSDEESDIPAAAIERVDVATERLDPEDVLGTPRVMVIGARHWSRLRRRRGRRGVSSLLSGRARRRRKEEQK